jgi:hypothetical protein
MADTIKYRFLLRRGLASSWTAKNELLLQGEFGLELDTGKLKIGNGTTAWNTLGYYGGGGGSATPMQINLQTGTSYTLVAADAGGDLQCNNPALISVTIPKDKFQVGDWLLSSQTGAGNVNYLAATGVTFETTGIRGTTRLGEVIGLEMIAANVWRFIGPGDPVLSDAPADGTLYGRKDAAWVAVPSASGNVGQLAGLNDQTGASYTVAATDAAKDIRCTYATAVMLYIDKQATVAVAANFWALVSQGGAGPVTIAIVAGSGVLLRSPNGAATTAIYDARGIERITGDEWRVW